MSNRARRWKARVILFLAGAAAAIAEPAYPQTIPCDRYTIRNLTLGSTLGAVRARFGREGVTTSVTREGQSEASAVEYLDGDATVYIVYDHRIDKKPEARIALLRGSLPPGPDALAGLSQRWGPPSTGPEALSGDLQGGPVVWIVEHCGLVVSAYRRQGSWWAGDVGTFVQIERIEDARRGGSPATPAILAMAAAAAERPLPGSPPLAAPVPDAPAAAAAAAPTQRAVTDAPPDRPPERIRYVPPTYPPNLRLMGVRGRVMLNLSVREDGTVGDARVVEAVPAGRGFEAAAIDAAKRWRYKPATRDGVAVAAEVPVAVEFR